jgi:putative SOS response-associated peptidase YedK
MCGRYSITTPTEALRKIFGFAGLPNLGANYNVAPTHAVPFVRVHDGIREMAMARWGLVPSWAKEIRPKPLINARGETVAAKPAFRSSFQRRRCLIPADGFYEWKAQERGPKQPYYIHRKDNRPFGMAGIWSDWMAPDGSELDTLAIITIDANRLIEGLHNRMPVIISEEDFETWLDPAVEKSAAVDALIRPAQEDLLEAYPVSTRVNRVGEDDAGLIEPIGPVYQPNDKTPSDDEQLDLL